MKIIVCMKQTFDTEAQITIKDNIIQDTGVELIINPYDEFAIEEALKLKEEKGEGEVVLISMGDEGIVKSLRTGLAMGADRAILVKSPENGDTDEWLTAEVLAKVIENEEYDIILSGRMAIDDGSSQVAVRYAEALGIPSVTSIINLNVEDGKAIAVKEIDGGSETLEVKLPAVFTAQKGLNEPRLPSMMGIMKAKKKELKEVTIDDIDIKSDDLSAKANVLEFSLPPAKDGGKIIEGENEDMAKELARLLREEAKVL